ncbi:protein of unknown function DUF262 [Parvibaculum lavamentivorans DS-1]|uniref:GmrSD restriction endonucleases N-terminal domain-containing protein n=1 Tax=Parvibaculum lavamentivorans (strain DS-1 / DSM 13023 / NCIMB 13966) TaxID=402881 RepID=A7HY21_PARL1|nr:DUF262 domain-containing protein [Parvibaculum lavamentivorans]ABS64804.1 protein of unknown function DUF262 [Parvibaculum lavamentivorans DS-1]
MHYTNSQMKLDQLIGYFNGKKINLIPPFQRGHVWKPEHRKRLLENMVAGRPIPAIFLYKEPAGSTFEYNILDGKQRLESLILFIGSNRKDMNVAGVKDYFFSEKERSQIHFQIEVDGKKTMFKNLSDEVVRDFREYAIPTIEIDLDDETSLDEIINLFVDINQQGEKVKRFDIVKAIGKKNKLLSSVFELVAQEQIRKQDKYFKPKNTAYSRVLDKLQIVEAASDPSQKVDRMWERLFELVLMNRTGKHRQPNQILKTFIKVEKGDDSHALAAAEKRKLQRVFAFLDVSYDETPLGESRLARDLPHFYTMVTTLLSSELLDAGGAAPDYPNVRRKLLAFSKLIKEGAKPPKSQTVAEALSEYMGAAAKQTTHPGRRTTREQKFLEILDTL